MTSNGYSWLWRWSASYPPPANSKTSYRMYESRLMELVFRVFKTVLVVALTVLPLWWSSFISLRGYVGFQFGF